MSKIFEQYVGSRRSSNTYKLHLCLSSRRYRLKKVLNCTVQKGQRLKRRIPGSSATIQFSLLRRIVISAGAASPGIQLMVKPKQRHIRSAPGKKRQNRRSTETDPLDDEDWMVVKKQRITILIPPLPNKVQSTMPNVRESQVQEKPRNTNSESPKKANSELQYPSRVSASKQSVHETEKSISLPQEQAVHHSVTVHPSEPKLTLQKPSSLSCRIASDNTPLRSFRDNLGIGKCSTSRGRKRMMYPDSSAILDPRMRASYLEKKLKKAGGLENWLVSLGLTRFVKVFQSRSITKFQLANLTMKKLKDMGTDAIGPRRKLMHAIDCLCEPHCFQHL
ncbi:hypothetical protein Salat_2588200 [Sesamum alatum]|uniref:SAM domain-containing protein n=1 Tax=Sesamum alatum TaxID=300844 RepID=A0AAE2CAB5_9LAMI|nr:hypothetical protein Salat_2588200 [Sesamum alatum]